MPIQKESELYLPIKGFLQEKGFEVKGEVHHCDLVALGDDRDTPIIVELKKTMNLSLVLQGLERQRLSDAVYLAVEKRKQQGRTGQHRFSSVESLCRKLGLGLITVQFFKTKPARVEVICDPDSPVSVRKSPRRQAKLLHEFNERSGDYNVGGSNKVKLLTAYRERALRCALILNEYGESTPRFLREKLEDPKISLTLQHNYYGWFARVKRGVYTLTNEGREALIPYQSMFHSDKSE